MKDVIKKTLIEKINKSSWWHVSPSDSESYKKRGKFFASTYQQAEFYGRPNDVPEKVIISNPIYGFSEIEILKILFPNNYNNLYNVVKKENKDWYKMRIRLDAQMCQRARQMGFDAIVLLGSNAKKYLLKNKKPHSMELNLCNA